MKKILFTSVMLALILCIGFSCKEQDIPEYNSRNALWFEKNAYNENNERIRLDTVEISSTFFPGQAEYTHSFKINLIGPLLTTPTEYRLMVVDTLSQVSALEYISMPEPPLFKDGVIADQLDVKIHVSKIPSGYRGYVTYTLVENENFREGYAANQTIKIWVNNIPTKPLWWSKTIEQVYLGSYSKEKYEAFILCTGLTSLDGYDSLEMRKICREFKKYVEDNGVTEADGSPMVIPIY